MLYVRQDVNQILPVIEENDVSAPSTKRFKQDGRVFDNRIQIARCAHRIQKWWNQPASRRSVFKRRELFSEFGLLVTLLSLHQPSSASAERVFSILDANFSDKQKGCKSDMKETTCQLIYNNRKV